MFEVGISMEQSHVIWATVEEVEIFPALENGGTTLWMDSLHFTTIEFNCQRGTF